MDEKYQMIEFDFVTNDGEITDPRHADFMLALFDCFGCGFGLRFVKKYEPVPLHYESLLKRCKDVICPKCGLGHRHSDVEGEDAVFQTVEPVYVNPNQLTLF